MAALTSEARSFPGLGEWTGFCPNFGQTEGPSQPGRKDIGSDPQSVANFTTAAENLRQDFCSANSPSVTCKRCYGVDFPQVRGPNGMRTKPAPMYLRNLRTRSSIWLATQERKQAKDPGTIVPDPLLLAHPG